MKIQDGMEILRKVAFWIACFITLDVSISGGGHYLLLGPLSVRMILTGVAFLLVLPVFIVNIKKYVKSPLFWTFSAFLFWMLICAYRGYAAGHKIEMILSDLKGFLWIVLVFIFVITVQTKEELKLILNFVLVGTLLLSLFVIFVNGYCSLVPKGEFMFAVKFNQFLLGSVGSEMDYFVYRVFVKSCPYMAVACVVSVFRQVKINKISWKYLCVTIINFTAIFLTYSRSLYLGLVLGLLLSVIAVVILYRDSVKRVLLFLLISIVLFVSISVCQELVLKGNYINYAISRCLDTTVPSSIFPSVNENIKEKKQRFDENGGTSWGKEKALQKVVLNNINYKQDIIFDNGSPSSGSNSIRESTLQELVLEIEKNPVFGNGLGNGVSSRDGGISELIYLDIIVRMGVLGLLLYIFPFVYVVYYVIKNWKVTQNFPELMAVIIGMICFWTISYFNPWMNSSIGISFYAITSTIPELLKKEMDKLEEGSIK